MRLCKRSNILVILLLYVVIWLTIKYALSKLQTRLSAHKGKLIPLFKKILGWFISILLIIGILDQLGVDTQTLIAGLGLTGFIIGFALKDFTSSLIAGITIIVYKPFQIGDRIKILNIEGEVDFIDIRYTVITTDTEKHIIPNSRALNEIITIYRDNPLDKSPKI